MWVRNQKVRIKHLRTGVVMLCALTLPCTAQSLDSLIKFPNWMRVTGSASVFSEVYFSGNSSNARRPPGTVRANIQTTLTVFDQFSIPFELLLSTEQVQFRQPFNQFAFAPRFGNDVQLYAGFHTLSLSSFSAGDIRINGGGADIKIGDFRLKASLGISRFPSLPDTTQKDTNRLRNAALFQTQPAFSQTMLAGRIAYEAKSGDIFGVNIVRARDDASSLDNSLLKTPLESRDNLTLALDASFYLVPKAIAIQGEIAASRNGSAWISFASPNCGIGEAGFRVSSDNLRLDYAGKLSISYEDENSPITGKLRGEYIGPGFVTVGFPQLPNDRFEADISLQTRLFENKITVSGSLGYAADNLAQDREITTGRIIGSLNLSAQITDEFGFDGQFQNYGIRTAPPPNYGIIPPNMMQPQLQTQQIFNLLSLMPRYSFRIDQIQHNISLAASWQEFADTNPETRRNTQNTSQMLRLLWLTTVEKLALTLNAGYTANESALAEFRATEIALTASYSLFEQKLTPTLTLSWTRSSESNGLESRTSATLRALYRLTKQTDIVMNMQGNYYTYRPGSRSPSYSEGQMSVEFRQRL